MASFLKNLFSDTPKADSGGTVNIVATEETPAHPDDALVKMSQEQVQSPLTIVAPTLPTPEGMVPTPAPEASPANGSSFWANQKPAGGTPIASMRDVGAPTSDASQTTDAHTPPPFELNIVEPTAPSSMPEMPADATPIEIKRPTDEATPIDIQMTTDTLDPVAPAAEVGDAVSALMEEPIAEEPVAETTPKVVVETIAAKEQPSIIPVEDPAKDEPAAEVPVTMVTPEVAPSSAEHATVENKLAEDLELVAKALVEARQFHAKNEETLKAADTAITEAQKTKEKAAENLKMLDLTITRLEREEASLKEMEMTLTTARAQVIKETESLRVFREAA